MDESQLTQLGPLMKAARKFKKLNQADVAEAIGCSQSALSKMEHNLLVPSAPQWFLFSRFTSIPPETLEKGVIDRLSKVKFNNDQVSLGFKIPKKYRQSRSEKVREVYPFLQYLEKKMSPPLHKEFILTTGLESEFFLDFDNLISFQFFIDLINYFIKIGKSSPSEIKGIVNFGQNDIYWNHIGKNWNNLHSIETLLEEYAKEQPLFQSDFLLKVESLSGKTTVSYYPEYHLKQVASHVSPAVVNFLNHYREASLEHLIDRFLGRKVSVKVQEEVSTSQLAARFEVKAA
jgi:transcriptional regulator with XRE-family HTH domain